MTSNDRELRKLPSGRTLLPGHGFPLPAGTSAGTGNAASQGSTAAAAAIDSSNPSATGPAGDTRGLAHPSATWSEQDNTVLLLARSQGIGYRQIAEVGFG